MKAPRATAVCPHDDHDGADSIERFAAKNAISRAQAYKEIAAGRLTARKVGARTIVTHEDAAKWRRALPKASARDARAKTTIGRGRGPGVTSTTVDEKWSGSRRRPKPQEEPGAVE